jgi:transposase
MTTQESKIYIGIDVSKALLDIFNSNDSSYHQYDNSVAGVKKFISDFKKIKDSQLLITLEATGGYEKLAARTLVEKGFHVTVINPRVIRAFAKASGKLAKTDKIDAKIIAEYTEKMQPESRLVYNENQANISELSTRRAQIIAMIVGEKNRLDKVSPAIRKSILRIIKSLEKELAEIDSQLKKSVQTDESFAQKHTLLTSVKGVGPKTATALIAYLPELGMLEERKIAALAGLAPFNCDSGKMRGKRMIWGGRSSVRTSLYMATMAAIRSNNAIRAFYHRLINAGKPRMVALTACMRKLIIIMNAMIRNNQPWHQNYAR